MAAESAELEFLVRLKDEATQALHGLDGVLKDVTGPLPDVTAGIDIDASGAVSAAEAAGKAADGVPEDFTAAGEEAGKGLTEGADKGMTKGKAALLAGVAALAVAAGAVFAEAIGQAMEAEDLNARLTGQLNLTGAESAKFGKIAGGLFASNYGGSLEEVNGAIASVVSSIGGLRDASDEDISAAAVNAMNLASTFDIDVAGAATSAGILIKTGLAGNATEAFDTITAAAQKVGPAMVDPLLEASNEYATYFQALGFSSEQAFATLTTATAGGEIALDKAGDAIKEFGIRSTDGSKSTANAYEDLGIAMDSTVDSILAGGPAAQGAMQEIITALLSVKDPGTQAADALALFGTPLEDIGVDKIPEFLTALQSTTGGMGDVAGRADALNATLGGTTSATLESLKRQFQATFVTQLGQTALPILSAALDLAVRFAGPLMALGGVLGAAAVVMGVVAVATAAWSTAQTIATAATGAWTAAQWLLTSALAAPITPILLVIAGIAALVALIVWFFTQTEVGQKIVETVWSGIKTAIAATVDWITGTAVPAVVAAWQWVVTTAQNIAGGVASAFTAVVSAVSGAVGAVVSWVTGAWDTVWGATTAVWGAVSGFFAEWWPLLLAIFAGPIFALLAAWNAWGDDILAAAKATWGFIRDAIIDPVVEFVLAVRDKIVEVETALFTKWEAIKTFTAAAWEAVRDAVMGPVTEFLTFVHTKLDEFGGWLLGKWDLYVAATKQVWGQVKAAVVDPVVEFITAVADKLDGFRDSVVEKIRDVVGAAKDTASEFLQVGEAIIDGIREGVANKARELASAVADAAHAALDAAKAALGIHSPSRVFRDEVGAMMGAGWAGGLDDAGADVVAAAEAIARDAAAAAADESLSVGAAAAGARPVTVNGASSSTATMTIRHEVVSPDGSVTAMTAADVADLLGRDPRSAAAVERALRPQRTFAASNLLSV